MTTLAAAAPLQELTAPGSILEHDGHLPEVTIRYRTYGTLSLERDNCVLLFTYYTGTDLSYLPWIGAGKALDPQEHFIVVINHLGGGLSSSPSNTPGDFPAITLGDNARAAREVLHHIGVRRVKLAAGWSLGGMQSLEFALQNPGAVESVLALCSAARCAEANQVFLDSVSAALTADPRFAEHDPERPPLGGLDAFGRVYAGWAYSEAFYADGVYRDLGYESPADVLVRWGHEHQVQYDAHDLMACLRMWRSADLGHGRGGLQAALGRLRARTILMPADTDSYFTLAENRREAAWLPAGELRVLESPLGHVAGRPGIRAQEQDEVDTALRDLLRTGLTRGRQPEDDINQDTRREQDSDN